MLKLITQFTILSVFSLFSSVCFAHAGHDHGAGSIQPPKGGILRSLETVNIELLTKGQTILIYAYDTNLKPSEVSQYPVEATVTLPKKNPVPLKLVPKGDHWEAEFDSKGSHRYTIHLAIKQGGHDDKLKFTVEPKK